MYTLDKKKLRELFAIAAAAAVKAGAKVMPIFNSDDYEITMKSDNTPFSLADKVAHEEIEQCLAKSRIPTLSEEGRDLAYDERKAWDIFWLIDPLDGTRQFIKRKNEFTINIALIINNYPELGIIYAPAYNELYFGHQELGSFKKENVIPASDINFTYNSLFEDAIKMPSISNKKYTILTSPNHTTQTTLNFIEEKRAEYTDIDIISMGSSLKMCLLADGKANIYVRHADTYEWDTAAAQAILEGAGCTIKSQDDGKRLSYNKESLKNPWFICERNITD